MALNFALLEGNIDVRADQLQERLECELCRFPQKGSRKASYRPYQRIDQQEIQHLPGWLRPSDVLPARLQLRYQLITNLSCNVIGLLHCYDKAVQLGDEVAELRAVD